MTIAATSGVSSSTRDTAGVRDTRADDERANDFAAMLSGAVKSAPHKYAPKRLKEATSELDKPDDPADDNKKKIKRNRPRAAETTSAAGSTDNVVQSTGALDPELQAKLARIAARMREETGHNVTVTETYRSQERQDALFAQGRETPGQIVTWTRNSKHTQGRAVDVMLDGGTANLDAYTTLQRVANEEGLRTLGARDPGHLELPGTGQPLSATSLPAEPADAVSPGGVSVAQVAEVAQVAQVSVAKPAEVARVASVARPDVPGIGATSRGLHSNGAPETTKAVAGAHTTEQGDGAGSAMQRASSEASNEKNGDSGSNGRGEHRGYGALAAAVAMRDMPAPHAASAIAGGAHVNGAERAAQIIAAYQDAPARPLSQITMNVDAGNGVTDRVQIAMRGASLNAAIEAGDTRGAQVMSQRVDELTKALTRDGIEVESLRVRGVASATTATAVAGSPQSQNSSDASTHSRFERNNPWQQQERQRSQDDRRQQQRNSRGGRDQ